MKDLEKRTGYCEVCNEPLGHLKGDSLIFCYKCEGYQKVEIQKSIARLSRLLERKRQEFKEKMEESDIPRYLNNYLDIGEGILNVHSEDRRNFLLSSLDKTKPYFLPSIKKGEYENSLISYNLEFLIIANLGIKWILEDHNFLYEYGTNYNTSI